MADIKRAQVRAAQPQMGRAVQPVQSVQLSTEQPKPPHPGQQAQPQRFEQSAAPQKQPSASSSQLAQSASSWSGRPEQAPVRGPTTGRTGDLDAASDHMAQILRRSDALLAEWSQFGAAVRAQVEREAGRIGDVVGNAVDTAVDRATASAIDRAVSERLGAQLSALSTEVTKLESRARAAGRAMTEHKRTDRGILIGLVVAVLLANGLLIALLVRRPAQPAMIAPEPVPVAQGSGTPGPDPAGSAGAVGPAGPPGSPDGSAVGVGSSVADSAVGSHGVQDPTVGSGSANAKASGADSAGGSNAADPKATAAKGGKPVDAIHGRPIKQGPPSGSPARRP